MTKVYKLIGVFLLVVYVMGCKDEDPKLPVPQVDFSVEPEIVEVGKPVIFKNLTLNASSYQWNFGDGQTSTQISPTITYEESGTYKVTLTAFTDDNQSDSLSRNITVGERVMTGISINSFPFINPDGNDWDDPAGQPDSTKLPDFILVLGPQDDPSRIIATPMLVDLAPFELPIGFNINPGGDPYILTNEDWELTFIDFDGTDIENAQEGDFEIMEVITFNPVTIPTGVVDENGQGFVQVSIGLYSVDLFFQIE
jgi:PKD repeat protein